ncbi:uncharacterized protein LOC108253005 [Diaphorina citri]|uniref:Uncharacterized protein LOC108253005 n=1 Tax=Diaphorina citri TaxID=121845 RepID=A0A1S4EHF6_DIACI|nr:uncharacterized protein LOC108253005 [Diaphorina citri]
MHTTLQWCFSSLNLPDNWVERIVGALVDPDLFPSEEEDLDSKRMKFCDPSETAGVFSDRSNFPAYLNVGPVYTSEDGEEMTNCDMKSNQITVLIVVSMYTFDCLHLPMSTPEV